MLFGRWADQRQAKRSRVAVPLRVRARVGGTGRAILVHMWGWAPRWMRAVAPPPTIVLAPALLRKRPPPSVQGADADSHPDLVGARPLHLVFNLSCPSACAGDADEPFRLANETSARCCRLRQNRLNFQVCAPPRAPAAALPVPLSSAHPPQTIAPSNRACAAPPARSDCCQMPSAGSKTWQRVRPPALPADPPLLLRRSASARCRAPNHHRGGASIGARLDHRAAPQCACR